MKKIGVLFGMENGFPGAGAGGPGGAGPLVFPRKLKTTWLAETPFS